MTRNGVNHTNGRFIFNSSHRTSNRAVDWTPKSSQLFPGGAPRYCPLINASRSLRLSKWLIPVLDSVESATKSRLYRHNVLLGAMHAGIRASSPRLAKRFADVNCVYLFTVWLQIRHNWFQFDCYRPLSGHGYC